jgi:L-threonylcarbamoyladenylate synthase
LSKTAVVDPRAPDPVVIGQAVSVLRRGGMVVLPTRHLYGLGVDALNPRAIARVFAVKQRPRNRPLLILVASPDDVGTYARNIDERAKALMAAFWPGRLTIVLEARPLLPTSLTGGSGRIGIRVPDHPVCCGLVRLLGRPITATSANISDQPGCHRIDDLPPDIASAAELVLDAGALEAGLGSTVVDVRPDEVRILREGTVTAADLKKTVRFSVTGPPANPTASGRQT